MSTFITNDKTNSLRDRMAELINFSQELKFLVGFFYFSGANELYNSLVKNPDIELKILVGLEVDKLANQITEKEFKPGKNDVENFMLSAKTTVNSYLCDNQDFYDKIGFFIQLIKNDKLKIKKTKNPNHAKLYIFNIKEEFKELKRSCFITGSSNLTRSGLIGQDEFNVEISDYGNEITEDYFDKLWRTSIPITENEVNKRKLLDILENESVITKFSPFEAYTLILKNMVETQIKHDIKDYIKTLLIEKGYTDYKYQTDAASQAISIIENYSGVIIADVVGLGKSIIAGIIAKQLGKRGVIICPPNLIGDRKSGWEKYIEDFALKSIGWEVLSVGDLGSGQNKVYNKIKDKNDIEVIIVDEAHRFRNEKTKRYEELSNICRGKIVILLSATPYNNKPADLLALLKLFTPTKQSPLLLNGSLDTSFKIIGKSVDDLNDIKKNLNTDSETKKEEIIKKYNKIFTEQLIKEIKDIDKTLINSEIKNLSRRVRNIIAPTTIRRNRIDLRNDPEYKSEIKNLPEVKDPEELFYELSKEQNSFYDKIINEYFGKNGQFKGAIYRPYRYDKTETKQDEMQNITNQNNLYQFSLNIIIRRFESSFGAFEKTIDNFINNIKRAKKFIEDNEFYTLDKKVWEIFERNMDEPEEMEEEMNEYWNNLDENLLDKKQKKYYLKDMHREEDFKKDIDSDLNLFEDIKEELKKLELVKNDPKIKSLVLELEHILEQEPENNNTRKVVIFSQYKDTVDHIMEYIGENLKKQSICVAGSLSSEKMDNILNNFDAGQKSGQKNDYNILIATDKIAEGFNLNRAGAIINYDIPWNPTIVIQRLGRINRISKMLFKKIYLYNFFPTEQGAKYARSREIASQKMFAIHSILGEDAKIFSDEEEPRASKLYDKLNENPEDIEKENFQTQLKSLYFSIKEKYPNIIEKIEKAPIRIKVAKSYKENNIFVFLRKGLALYIQGIREEDKDTTEYLNEDVLEYIKCEVAEPRLDISDDFWPKYKKIKEIGESESKLSRNSNEEKAYNFLSYLLEQQEFQVDSKLEVYYKFIKDLMEDILDFGSLSENTLQEIARAGVEIGDITENKKIDKVINLLERLKNCIGINFLDNLKKKNITKEQEIIIAIQNIKH